MHTGGNILTANRPYPNIECDFTLQCISDSSISTTLTAISFSLDDASKLITYNTVSSSNILTSGSMSSVDISSFWVIPGNPTSNWNVDYCLFINLVTGNRFYIIDSLTASPLGQVVFSYSSSNNFPSTEMSFINCRIRIGTTSTYYNIYTNAFSLSSVSCFASITGFIPSFDTF